jgi:excisionase family DNA binding protein
MRTLYLRNVPDEVVERLERLAARDRISVAAVAVRELEEVSRRVDNPMVLGALPDLDIDPVSTVADLDEGRSDLVPMDPHRNSTGRADRGSSGAKTTASNPHARHHEGATRDAAPRVDDTHLMRWPAEAAPLVLTVTEAASLLGVSRALAYELVARGEIPSLRLGRRLVVPRARLIALLESRSTT